MPALSRAFILVRAKTQKVQIGIGLTLLLASIAEFACKCALSKEPFFQKNDLTYSQHQASLKIMG
jgi:hypothetical protein